MQAKAPKGIKREKNPKTQPKPPQTKGFSSKASFVRYSWCTYLKLPLPERSPLRCRSLLTPSPAGTGGRVPALPPVRTTSGHLALGDPDPKPRLQWDGRQSSTGRTKRLTRCTAPSPQHPSLREGASLGHPPPKPRDSRYLVPDRFHRDPRPSEETAGPAAAGRLRASTPPGPGLRPPRLRLVPERSARPPARRGAGRGPGRQDAERAASGLPRAQLPAAGGCGRPRQGRGLAAGVAVGCRGLPRHRGPAGAAGDRRWGRARGPGPVRGGGLSPAARPGPSRRSRGGLPAGSRLRLGQGCLWALPCKGSGPPATAEGTRRLWQGPRARSWSAALKNSSHFSF